MPTLNGEPYPGYFEEQQEKEWDRSSFTVDLGSSGVFIGKEYSWDTKLFLEDDGYPSVADQVKQQWTDHMSKLIAEDIDRKIMEDLYADLTSVQPMEALGDVVTAVSEQAKRLTFEWMPGLNLQIEGWKLTPTETEQYAGGIKLPSTDSLWGVASNVASPNTGDVMFDPRYEQAICVWNGTSWTRVDENNE